MSAARAGVGDRPAARDAQKFATVEHRAPSGLRVGRRPNSRNRATSLFPRAAVKSAEQLAWYRTHRLAVARERRRMIAHANVDFATIPSKRLSGRVLRLNHEFPPCAPPRGRGDRSPSDADRPARSSLRSTTIEDAFFFFQNILFELGLQRRHVDIDFFSFSLSNRRVSRQPDEILV